MEERSGAGTLKNGQNRPMLMQADRRPAAADETKPNQHEPVVETMLLDRKRTNNIKEVVEDLTYLIGSPTYRL